MNNSNNCPCGVCALPINDRDFVLCHKACVKPVTAKPPPIPSWFDLHTRLKDYMPPPASITQLLELFKAANADVSDPIRTAEEIVLVPTFVSSSSPEELP